MNNCQQQKARSSSKWGCFLKTTFSECASDTNTPFEQKRTILKQPKIGFDQFVETTPKKSIEQWLEIRWNSQHLVFDDDNSADWLRLILLIEEIPGLPIKGRLAQIEMLALCIFQMCVLKCIFKVYF